MRKGLIVLCWGLAAVLGVSAEAQAAFIGDFDVSHWLTNNPPLGIPVAGGGTVDTTGAPNSIQLLGGNSGCSSGSGTCILTFTTSIGANGFISFHWDYVSTDRDGPGFDHFGVLLNGAFPQLSNDGGSSTQAGNSSFPVLAGDRFGFFINCTDCIFGPANVTISEFTEGDLAATPEPGTILLLGTGLVGTLTALRRRR
ncbi:MAG TPA: PEP-CTERM sorting domain-containing protein [Methylomirabilota bacterium]|nr:PEP-CTERM sorting domain-containing protein [Methylomirabilota bacterium]